MSVSPMEGANSIDVLDKYVPENKSVASCENTMPNKQADKYMVSKESGTYSLFSNNRFMLDEMP